MSITETLHDSTAVPGSELQFRRIPVEQLRYHEELFDERVIDHQKIPEMISPIIVCENGENYRVIDGCKRLYHAKATGCSACNCALFTPPLDDYHAALLRMTLNRGRSLHFYEKMLFVRWLMAHCNTEQSLQIAQSLSLNRKEVVEFEKLRSCDVPVIEAVATGHLERCFASEVQQFSDTDRKEVVQLFTEYTFSRQMQRELLDWLPELAFRERSTIYDLLQSRKITEIRLNRKLNGPQKIERIRSELFNRRFPTISRAKNTWNTTAATLNPDPSHVQFKPSEAFEKNRLELRITATSAEQARKIFAHLAEIEPEMWDRLIYPAQLYSSS